LVPPTPRPLVPSSFQRILVFSAAGIGDTLTDSVAIRALKESFPKARIHVVTHRRRRVIADHNPYIDEVIPYYKSLLAFPGFAWRLRRWRPDVVVMLRGNDPDLWPTAYIAQRHAVVSCPRMTQFSFLISHPVSLPKWDETHGVEQTLEIVRTIGADCKDQGLVYKVRAEEIQAFQKKWKIPSKPSVVFQVGGGGRSRWRDWPVESFVELARWLLQRYDVNLFLSGGVDLIPKARAVAQGLPQAVNLVGQLSLSETAALLASSKILVSTDTGIMHLGFAVGIDTLALIHCNNPASRVGPYGYGNKHRVAQLVPPPGRKPDKTVDMRGITVPQVTTLLDELCKRHMHSHGEQVHHRS